MPISNGALVSIFCTLDATCVVTLSMMMFSSAMSKQFSREASGATESIVQQTHKHQLFFTARIFFFVWDFPEPSFVLVRLVDEVPEGVIEWLHIFCTITFADVADQRAAHAELRSDVFL